VYSINKKTAEYISGKEAVLLCDDIITTGNTLKECTRILHAGGLKNVYCATIAYV
jgi:predicted amidophosphoribosyltransferase